MATEDTLDAQPAALENTILEHRFDHILATRGRKAARRRRQGRDERPVEIDGEQKNLAQHDFPFVICDL